MVKIGQAIAKELNQSEFVHPYVPTNGPKYEPHPQTSTTREKTADEKYKEFWESKQQEEEIIEP